MSATPTVPGDRSIGSPVITGISALSAPAGRAITITGVNFAPGLGLALNGVPIPVFAVTHNQIVFPFPANVACRSILSATNPDGQVAFIGLNPQPRITATNGASGPADGGAAFIVLGHGSGHDRVLRRRPSTRDWRQSGRGRHTHAGRRGRPRCGDHHDAWRLLGDDDLHLLVVASAVVPPAARRRWGR
ncbi:MAG: IPT/TIG domain-containing protein [Planctomycetota bacterium]